MARSRFESIYSSEIFPDIYRMLVDEKRTPQTVYRWATAHYKAKGRTGRKLAGFNQETLEAFSEMLTAPTVEATRAYILSQRELEIHARLKDLEILDQIIEDSSNALVLDPNAQYNLDDLFRALDSKTRLVNSAGFQALMAELQKANGGRGVVDAVTFATDPYFCNVELFPWQRDALKKFFQPQYEFRNLVAIMGMGSGKGVLGSIIAWYCAYMLWTLDDPQKYWGFVAGQEIVASLNMATSEEQAKNMVFKHIKDRAEHGGDWFRTPGLIEKVLDMEIKLGKDLVIRCGHSKATQLVGGTVFCAVFDELCRYKNSEGSDNAEDVYSKINGSTKRFSMEARSVVISSPEWEGDLGMRLLAQAKSGEFPRMLGIQMPSWEASPLITYESLADEFRRNPRNAERDYGANPPMATEAYFRNRKLLEASPTERPNPVKPDGSFESWFAPCCDAPRYVHVDLAKSRDSCGLAVVHMPVQGCPHVQRKIPMEKAYDQNMDANGACMADTKVYVDLLMRFDARNGDIDFGRVRQVIFDLVALGFLIKLGGVTYDRWQSVDSIQQLIKAGIPAELLSVDRTTAAYDTVQELLNAVELDYYNLYWDAVPPAPGSVVEELKQLQIKNGIKIDHADFGCFTGDTRVALLDGTNPTFAELVERYGDGTPFYVYSVDGNNNLTVGEACKPRVTRQQAPIVDVELDQGIHIRCTPDHLFMRRNGNYCRADELEPMMSLMPLYRNYSENVTHEYGYEQVWTPANNRIKTHWLVADWVGIDREALVVHHKDGNKRNNSPDNLVGLTHQEHTKLHGHDLWSARRAGMRKGHAEYVANGGGAVSREVMRRSWAEGKFGVGSAHHMYRQDVTFEAILAAMPIGLKALGKKLGCGVNTIKERLQDEQFVNWQAFARWFTAGQPPRNHIVLSVAPCGTADVYDIEVAEYHNFALASGVFVHNSKDVSDSLAGAVHHCVAKERARGRNIDTLKTRNYEPHPIGGMDPRYQDFDIHVN